MILLIDIAKIVRLAIVLIEKDFLNDVLCAKMAASVSTGHEINPFILFK